MNCTLILYNINKSEETLPFNKQLTGSTDSHHKSKNHFAHLKYLHFESETTCHKH